MDHQEKSEHETGPEIEIYHDAEEINLQNESKKIGSIIFTKSNKSYPNWPGKILNIHLNNNDCLVEFFQKPNWMIVPISKLHKFDNIEAFKTEASKSKHKNEFDCALKEANTHFEKMQQPISWTKHLDQNDSTRVKNKDKTSDVPKLYPNLNLKNFTQGLDTDNTNATTSDQDLHENKANESSPSEQKNNADESIQPEKHDKKTKSSICKGYLKGVCPHRVTGKRKIEGQRCRYSHPQRCTKYCKYGDSSCYGCKRGINCKFLHPILCKNSVKLKTCLKHDCKFTHLKGTKRKTEETKTNDPYRSTEINHRLPTQEKEKVKHCEQQNDHFFGEVLSQMRQLINEEMKSFKRNIDKKILNLAALPTYPIPHLITSNYPPESQTNAQINQQDFYKPPPQPIYAAHWLQMPQQQIYR